jgi:hypothetical protein
VTVLLLPVNVLLPPVNVLPSLRRLKVKLANIRTLGLVSTILQKIKDDDERAPWCEKCILIREARSYVVRHAFDVLKLRL